MENFLRSRIGARLDALGVGQFEAARAAGLNRYMVSDLLSGKKDTMRPRAVVALAEALQCDPGYLMGTQAEVRRA